LNCHRWQQRFQVGNKASDSRKTEKIYCVTIISDDEVKSFYEEHKDAIPALHLPQDQITGPQDSKYVPYEDIKDRLKDELEENKRIDFFAKKIDVLKKEYDVVVDETHFR
jgi:hypothetical protein